MKKMFLVTAAACILFTACGNTADGKNTAVSDTSDITDISAIDNKNGSEAASDSASQADENTGKDVDIDLTVLDSNMVYAQVYDMVTNGDKYMGQTVKAKGKFAYYKDEETGKEYFAVLVNDAAACCSQGIEFVLDGEYKYPDDYPELDKEITITGKFNYYKENFSTYCQLLDAKMIG